MKTKCNGELVPHICNPSYLGDREQEDHSLKPGQVIVEKPNAKNGCWNDSSSRTPAFFDTGVQTQGLHFEPFHQLLTPADFEPLFS
jgi:hypothetical protein